MEYIEKRLFGQRPHLKNQRLLVATIAKQIRLSGWTAEFASRYFKISEAEIQAALDYYAANQLEIDLQEMSEEARRDNRFCEG